MTATISSRLPRRLWKQLVISAATATLLVGCASPEERAAKAAERWEERFEQDDFQGARLEIRTALRERQDYAPYWSSLGRTEAALGFYQSAFNAFMKALQLDEREPEALIGSAELLFAAGQNDQAQENLDKYLALKPDDARGLVVQAAIHFRENRLDEAEAELAKVFAEKPDDLAAVILDARVKRARSGPEAGVAAINTAIGRIGEEPALVRTLISFAQEDDQSAVAPLYRRLIDASEEKTAPLFDFARYLIDTDKLNEAEAVLDQAVAAQPDDLDLKIAVVQFVYSASGLALAQKKLDEYIAQDPLPELVTERARLSLLVGRPADAEAQLEPLVQEDLGPNNVNAFVNYAIAAREQGKLDIARRVAEQVIAFDPGQPQALALRGQINMTEGNFDDALSDARQVLKSDPESLAGLLLLADAHQARGEEELERRALFQAAEEHPGAPVAAQRFVRFLLERGRTREAENAVAKLIDETPALPTGYALEAEVRMAQGDFAGAQQALAKARERELDGATDTMRLGALLEYRQATGRESLSVAEAVQTATQSQQNLLQVAREKIASGQYDEAKRFLREVIEQQPDNLLAKVVLGNVYGLTGDVMLARRQYDEALAADPTLDNARVDRALLMAAQGDIAGARRDIESALEQRSQADYLKFTLATLLYMDDEKSQAVTMLEELLAKEPDNLLVRNNLAALIAEISNEPAALARALTIADGLQNSPIGVFQDTYGWLLHRNGRSSEAVEVLKAAARTAPGVAEIRYHYAVALLALDQPQAARKELEAALRLAAGNEPWLAEARRQLERVRAI